MPDPLFGAAFFVGILGNLLAKHIDPAGRGAAEAIFARLTSGSSDLPPNHDLERVCRASLRQALELMAQAMDLQVAQPKSLVEAMKNRFDAQGRWKPMIEWWHTEEKEWFTEFNEAIASDEFLGRFDLRWIKGASSLNDPLRSRENPALEKQFGDALIEWTERHVQRGKRPIFFDEWVREGWPVAKDSPSVRISIFPAWCLFLQHHFKDDPKVQAILTADWLASIDERLRNLPVGCKELSAALQEPLGEQLELLTELREQVQELAESHTGLAERTGQLFALVLEFRNEVGEECSELRLLLTQTHAVVLQTHAGVVTSNVKLDTVIAKLDVVIAMAQAPPAPALSGNPGPVAKRIADSKLLASDGAARLKKLVGRSQEKALLTSAWRDGATRVLSFVAWGGAGKTSVVLDWLTDHVNRRWSGVDAFFDWSFYSQGTKDQSSVSSDAFFSAALRHFGLDAVAGSAESAVDKASKLAAAIRQQRTLLVLDGLEPLQHPRKPGQEEGRLKDDGIATLLRLLAQSQELGLCIITTRVPVVDLTRFHGGTVREVSLNHLSVRHGAELLHLAGAQFAGAAAIEEDDRELRATAKQVKGHAMTLQMLGGYLRSAQECDILRRDRVDFAKAFGGQLEGHTYNLMEAYEQWFQAEGPRGRRQLAVLRMMGLFDRVADAECIAALRKDGGIAGVSDAVAALSDADWQETLTHLGDHRLVFVNRETHDLDAHPLLREYFANQLRERNPDAWRAAHKRLYEHLSARTQEGREATFEDLQPLYQAVAHGCHAELHQAVLDEVYYRRIVRQDEKYSTRRLGAYGSDLGAVACLFETPWSRVASTLSDDSQAWLRGQAAFLLRVLGRLNEALEPMRAALDLRIQTEAWKAAAVHAGNLSDLELMLGKVAWAVRDAEQCVIYADRSDDSFQHLTKRASHAHALHQAGRRAEAEAGFRNAEEIQAQRQPAYQLLYSVQGFRYCDLLLADPERNAWRITCSGGLRPPKESDSGGALRAVSQRAAQTLKWAEENNASPLSLALEHLTLGCAALYAVPLDHDADTAQIARREVGAAMAGFRRAGVTDFAARGLLSRAWMRFLDGVPIGPESAQEDLDEAWEIAERGPMKLILADIHLHRARLFFREPAYPWESPAADLAAARKLIEQCGYWRRKEELEDAEGWLREQRP